MESLDEQTNEPTVKVQEMLEGMAHGLRFWNTPVSW